VRKRAPTTNKYTPVGTACQVLQHCPCWADTRLQKEPCQAIAHIKYTLSCPYCPVCEPRLRASPADQNWDSAGWLAPLPTKAVPTTATVQKPAQSTSPARSGSLSRRHIPTSSAQHLGHPHGNDHLSNWPWALLHSPPASSLGQTGQPPPSPASPGPSYAASEHSRGIAAHRQQPEPSVHNLRATERSSLATHEESASPSPSNTRQYFSHAQQTPRAVHLLPQSAAPMLHRPLSRGTQTEECTSPLYFPFRSQVREDGRYFSHYSPYGTECHQQ